MITEGNTPMPDTRRQNCISTTAAPLAPISAAMIGVSLMPPGTAHMKAVSQSTLDVR